MNVALKGSVQAVWGGIIGGLYGHLTGADIRITTAAFALRNVANEALFQIARLKFGQCDSDRVKKIYTATSLMVDLAAIAAFRSLGLIAGIGTIFYGTLTVAYLAFRIGILCKSTFLINLNQKFQRLGLLIPSNILAFPTVAPTANQTTYLNNLCESFHQEINRDQPPTTLSAAHKEANEQMIDDLKKSGHTKISGTAAECHVPAVSVQGAFEEYLANALRQKTIKSLEVACVTPLPSLPLRTKIADGHTSESFDTARQYTLDKRERTIRKMLDAGAVVRISYSFMKYEELKQKTDQESTDQVTTYSSEVAKYHESRESGRLLDRPFDDRPEDNKPSKKKIPEDLTGTSYRITDLKDNVYFISTNEIPATNVQPGEWEKWMAPGGIGSRAEERALAMFNFGP